MDNDIYYFNRDEDYKKRSYEEDAKEDGSGLYENTCPHCEKNFYGSKYRMGTMCKLCVAEYSRSKNEKETD